MSADIQARAAALDTTRSFCVQAPAGSGKTELLTQRILCLLATCDKPEEILAFTFTRKAAAEMRERLLHSLQSAALTSTHELAALPEHKRHTLTLAKAVLARDAQFDWQLLNNSRRLRINTIDSFTQYLTAQLPLSASFGARPDLSTDMERVFAQAIRQTLGWLEKSGGISADIGRLLAHLHGDLGRAENLLLNLLHKRDQWLPLVVALRQHPEDARALLELNLRDMLDDTLQAAHAKLLPLQTLVMPLVNFAGANLDTQGNTRLSQWNFGAVLPAPDATQAGAWRALATTFLKSDCKEFLGSPNVRHGFPSEKERKQLCDDMKATFKEVVARFDADGRLPLMQHLAMLPDATYSDEQWEILSALTAILPQLAAELDVAMRQAGEIDHTQTSLAALQALGTDDEPTDLALRLDYRIRHILVDEFQDTSSLQFHLLEKLTAGWQHGDGRTLFIVGDGMQSCYAFRNANVGLFLRARDEGIGPVKLDSLQLSVNFRSDRSVVDWVNTVFSCAFPREDDVARGGVRYSHSEARHAETATSGVHCQLWTYEKDDNNDKETRRALEAAEVAGLCTRLQKENPEQSIAILVRNRTHLDAIVPALRAAGLRWNASEIDPLLSYPAIGDLFTLLRALLNLADTSAWFALLRTPFVALPFADVEQIALHASVTKVSVWTALQSYAELPLSAEAQSRLRRCVPLLQLAREQRQNLPPRILLEQLWIALGGPACITDAAMLPNVAAFLDLVDTHTEQGDIPDLHRFEAQLEKCYGSAADPALNLHIMTIHKAKGLEFDSVILPGLDREPRSDNNALLMWKEYLDASNASRPLLAVLHSKGDAEEALYQYLRFEAGLRNRLEITRLLYIAVTRAARQAFLFGFVKIGKSGPQAPASSLLESILPALLDHPALPGLQMTALPVAASTSVDATQTRHVTQTLQRLPANWQWPAALPPVLTAPAASEAFATTTPERLATRIGELVHLGLRTLTEHGDAWLARSTTLPFWRRALLPFCHSEDALQRALDTVHHHLQQCISSPDAEWLFRTAHADAACELALCDYGTGWRRDYVVDRTFIDNDGTRWIIDYKSTMPAPGQALADFYTEQAALYRAQLQTYARLLGADAKPAIALFFTGLPALHVLD